MAFGGRRVRGIQAGMEARELGVGFLAHRAPELIFVDIAGRVAGQEIDMALESRVEAVRVVARTLRQFGGQDQVAVGVLDVDRALGYLSPINYERRYPPLRKSITVHESGATPDGPQKANDHFDQTRLSVLEHPHLLF